MINFAFVFRFVAQLVEHVTLNHGVEGSIPSEPTNYTGFRPIMVIPFFYIHCLYLSKKALKFAQIKKSNI